MSRPGHPIDLDLLLAQSDWIGGLARALAREPGGADDLFQETWLVALERAPTGAGPEGLRRWLGVVLRNLARRGRRSDATRAWHERKAARPEVLAGGMDERLVLQRRLTEAVITLPEPYRTAIALRWLEGRPPREVADCQGISYDAACQRLSRGMAMLRARLDREWEGGRAAWCVVAASFAPKASTAAVAALGGGGAAVTGSHAGWLVGIAVLAAGIVLWAVREPSLQRKGPASDDPVAAAFVDAPALGPDSVPATDPVSEPPPPPLPTDVAASGNPLPPGVDRTGDLHGWVLNTEGDPIAGARLIVRERVLASDRVGGAASTNETEDAKILAESTSDSLGVFAIPIQYWPAVDLEVQAQGYGRVLVLDRHPGEQVRVKLARRARLHGRVTGKTTDWSKHSGRIELSDSTPWGDLQSDARIQLSQSLEGFGEYGFDDLAPGSYVVRARSSMGSSSLPIELALAEGEERKLDVVFRTGQVVTGVVRDAITGAPIEDAEVGAGLEYDNPVRTDRGRYSYEVHFDRGQYGLAKQVLVSARATGYAQGAVQVHEHPGRSRASTDIELVPGRNARGIVLGPYGGAVRDALVLAVGAGSAGWDRRSTRTGAHGEFELDGLHPDKVHFLQVRAHGFAALEVAFPGDELERPEVEFGFLSLSAGASVRGIAIDRAGTALPSVPVVLRLLGEVGTDVVRGPAHMSRIHVTRTDDLGSFRFNGLSAGDWGAGTWMAERGWRAEGRIRVHAGEEISNLRLETAAGPALSGRVIDRSGSQPRGMLVSAMPQDGGPENCVLARTDRSGYFSLDGLDRGEHWLEVWPNDDRMVPGMAAIRIGVRAGQSDVKVELPEMVEMRGTVLDRSRKPAALVRVSARDRNGVERDFDWTDAKGRYSLRLEFGYLHTLEARPTQLEAGDPAQRVADPDPDRVARLEGVQAGRVAPDLVLP